MLKGLLGWRSLAWLSVNAAVTLLFSLRWWLILAAFGHRVNYLKLAGYRLAGFAISFITPGPQFGGEPLLVYALTRNEHIPNAQALASVGLDKSLELLASFIFLAAGMVVVLMGGLLPVSSLLGMALPLAALILLPVGYLVLLWLGKRPVSRLLGILFARFAGYRRRAGRIESAVSQFSNWAEHVHRAEDLAGDFCRYRPGLFALIVIQSLLVWFSIVVEYWLSFWLLGLWLPVQQVVFLLVAARLAMVLPAPGGIGPLEASQALAAQVLNVAPAVVVSVMLLVRARDFLLAGTGGILAAYAVQKPAESVEVMSVQVEETKREGTKFAKKTNTSHENIGGRV